MQPGGCPYNGGDSDHHPFPRLYSAVFHVQEAANRDRSGDEV